MNKYSQERKDQILKLHAYVDKSGSLVRFKNIRGRLDFSPTKEQ